MGRTFTLFHEVAHLINRTSGLCALREFVDEEAIANNFAANFLMPESAVRAQLNGPLARISGPGVGGKFTGPPERFWGRHALPSGSFQRSRIQAVVANHLLNNRLVIHQV